jgi:futalosine hydrolase
MRILIVAATEAEIAGLRAFSTSARAEHERATVDPPKRFWREGGQASGRSSDDINILTTGVGMVATAARTARALAQTRYDLALNFGVCGSFDRALTPGRVVHVVSDRIAELGAEDDDVFLTIDELQLPGAPVLVNAAPPDNDVLRSLPTVSGITVNTVHGSERSIADVVRRFGPQVESMEGAAFMHACLISNVPFAQVRAVSNMVEKRNREAWNLGEAIASLGRCACAILERV